jgi:hypothetical protein
MRPRRNRRWPMFLLRGAQRGDPSCSRREGDTPESGDHGQSLFAPSSSPSRPLLPDNNALTLRSSYKMSSLPALSPSSPSSLLLLYHKHPEWFHLHPSAVRLMSTALRPLLPSRHTSCAPLLPSEVSTLVMMSVGSGKSLCICMRLDISDDSSGVMGMKYAIHTFTGLPYDTPADDFVVGASDKALVTSILSAGTFFGM